VTQRCPYCHRFCTDQHICDAMACDWWSWNWADEWDAQIAEHRYVEIPPDSLDDGTRRIVIIAEHRWESASKYEVPSRLWDGAQTARRHAGYWSAA